MDTPFKSFTPVQKRYTVKCVILYNGCDSTVVVDANGIVHAMDRAVEDICYFNGCNAGDVEVKEVYLGDTQTLLWTKEPKAGFNVFNQTAVINGELNVG